MPTYSAGLLKVGTLDATGSSALLTAIDVDVTNVNDRSVTATTMTNRFNSLVNNNLQLYDPTQDVYISLNGQQLSDLLNIAQI